MEIKHEKNQQLFSKIPNYYNREKHTIEKRDGGWGGGNQKILYSHQ